MPGPFGHYGHVVRVAVLFAAALLSFLFIRSWLVPPDFGRLGFYRAGALDDIAARPVAFAGEATCATCHAKIFEERQGTRHASLRCEACHGPSEAHALKADLKLAALDPRKPCMQCHAKIAGRPTFVPQVVVADHSGDAECTACHNPHSPKIQTQ